MKSALTGEQIVYAANDWRTDNRTSSHHIVSYLAAKNRILYLEAAGQRAPRLSVRDMKRALTRVQRAFGEPVQAQRNIHVFSPFILPFHKYRGVRRLNDWLLNRSVAHTCRNLAFDRPIVWLTIPHYGAIIDALDHKGVVYYCTDDFASFPKVDRQAIQVMESRILSKANVVFTVSETLLEIKKQVNRNTFLSPHGVDTAHFGKALQADVQIPDDIARIPRPIAGFFGLVEEWFDTQLLDYCASQNKDISYVLIGRAACNIHELLQRPNVHFLGPKLYEQLPNYLKAFDVGLIPFRASDTVRHSNPLKFKEYLAGGKPVVSVRIQAFEEYDSLAYLTDTYEEFASAIRRSIAEDSPEKALQRVSAMAGESWAARAERVCERVRASIPRS